MATRPLKRLRWATETYYTGETPGPTKVTRVEPDATGLDDGFKSPFRPPSQHMNYALGTLADAGDYLDALEVLNFAAPVDVGTGNSNTAVCSMAATSDARVYLAIDDNVYSTRVGRVWALETLAGSPPTFRTIVADRTNVVVAGVGEHMAVFTGGAWTDVNTNAQVPTGDWWSSSAFGGSMYIGGASISGNPRIMKYDAVLARSVVLSQTVPAGFTGVANVDLMAASATLIVAVASDPAGLSNPAVWYSANGTAWTLVRPATTDKTFVTLVWNEAATRFELVANSGEVWTSPDGATWTMRVPAFLTNLAPNRNCLAIGGGLWLGVAVNTTPAPDRDELFYSVDQGDTWAGLGAGAWEGFVDMLSAEKIRVVRYLAGRFWSVRGPSTPGDPHVAIASLRLE